MTGQFPDTELEYNIFSASTAYELVILVNKKLAEGWKLAGGVASEGGCKYQAMTRENPKLISDNDPDEEYSPQELIDPLAD